MSADLDAYIAIYTAAKRDAEKCNDVAEMCDARGWRTPAADVRAIAKDYQRRAEDALLNAAEAVRQERAS